MPSAEIKRTVKRRGKKMLAELTLYDDKKADVHIFTEAKMTRNGNSVEVKAINNDKETLSGERLFSLVAEGEESVSLIVDSLMPIYLVHNDINDAKTYDTAISAGVTIPPVFSTCREIKNTLSEKGGELDVRYDVNLAFMDVYPKRIHLTLKEDNRK